MNKKFLISIFTLSIILAGCGNSNENSAKSTEVSKTQVNNTVKSESITNVTKETPKKATSNEEYINRNIQVYNFKSAYYQISNTEKIAGCEFKIKNTGNKTISELEATIYFKDKDGNNIAEEKFYPIKKDGGRISLEELKPNYIWSTPKDSFYGSKRVPSEWLEGKAEAKITAIKFID